MLAMILLSTVVEAARVGRYRSPSPARQQEIKAREVGQIARIDTERANFEALKAEHEKTQAALMAAQAKFEHEQNQLHLLHQYTSELTELQKEAEQNAEKIDAVVQKIQALNLASIQEATHEVKVAQAEVVNAAQDAGQPVTSVVAEAGIEADKAFVEAAHAATEGGSPSTIVETPTAITIPTAETVPEVKKSIEEPTPIPTPGVGMSPEPSMTEMPAGSPTSVAVNASSETPEAPADTAPAPMAPVTETPAAPADTAPVAAS